MDVIEAVQDQVLQEFRNSSNSRRIPGPKLKTFAVDLALIALSVRTAYLVDAIVPSDPSNTFRRLLHSLRQKVVLFSEVVLFYEPSSEQSFFVNAPLFLSRTKGFISTAQSAMDPDSNMQATFFASLHPCCNYELPADLIVILRELANGLGSVEQPEPITTIHLPKLPPHVAVPLAGFLLEYSVALCPNASGLGVSSHLNQVPLDNYECLINIPGKLHEHVLLKFSCPSSLALKYPRLSPSSIIHRLKSRFEDRLKIAIDGSTMSIQHNTMTLDRVAL
ncbi:hypothetical protein Moror_11855 [Moniliophthora roreri MCA 2997]|uniref:Uncharacterized protein n=1 Tax=Moniliophthora roreri (strain MCA 2997) TaxID=1381753 RepID=V2X029_MONRO|nr:hypothetical protein Moror_11855 [Moniliophthora roreri MCA 2997]KAI3607639.1 hypothetical protein WG66_004521 [Moniliophthora roreri]